MKSLAVCVIICVLSSFCFAQTSGVVSNAQSKNGSLLILTDYTCFKYSDNIDLAFTEIYYSFYRSQLYFRPDTLGYNAWVDVYIEIISETGELIDSSSWRMTNWTATIAESKIPNYLINDIITAKLKPGKYSFTIKIADVYSEVSGEKKIEFSVPSYSYTELELSQLELIYSISNPDTGPFNKAGKKLIPNTRAIYSHDDNIVYFYAEAYNFDSTRSTYTIDIRIYDGNGNLYKNIPSETQPISSKSAVILNGFNIASFKVGMYKLAVGIHSSGKSVIREKYFEITPGQLEWEIAREKQELVDFPEADKITSDDEAKNFRNQILYLATRDELKQYDKLPLNGKSEFAKAFWKRRDPTPETAINEYKIKHYARFRFANEAYSTFKAADDSKKNGWRSDRGRVYIVYGEPSDEENNPSSLEAKPWLQWNYDNIEGGIYFVFIDETGFGNYRLVHSSAQSEPKDYNWEERLIPSSIGR